MNRSEARKQIKTGWISMHLGSMFMGFDLDTRKLDPYIDNGALSTRNTGADRLVRLDDVLAIVDRSVNDLLDQFWPVNRQRKPDRVQTHSDLATRAEQDDFRRKWDRLHRQVSRWVADRTAKLTDGELRLAFQLLELSRRSSSFDMVLVATQLQKSTGLDHEGLPKARRSLEGRRMLTTERCGTTAWLYTLCDPGTGKPLTIVAGSDAIPFIPLESWADSEHD